MEILRGFIDHFRKPTPFVPAIVNPLKQLGIADALKGAGLPLRVPENRHLARVFIDEAIGEIEKGTGITPENLVQRFQTFREINPLKEDNYHGYLTLGLIWSIAYEKSFWEWQKYLEQGGDPDDENHGTPTGKLVDLLFELAKEQNVEPYELSGIK